uniref:Secreted protein n=1 Tax=Arundo donax TaxID=35708 RepID=A0A0A9F3Y1_ARUDO
MLLLMMILTMTFMNLSTSYCYSYTAVNQTLARVFCFFFLHTMHWSSNGSICCLLVQPLRYIFFIGVLTLMKHFKLRMFQSLAKSDTGDKHC